MSRFAARPARLSAAALTAGALVSTAFLVPAHAQEAPQGRAAAVTADVLYFNDYHGRLDSDPITFAGAIESQRRDSSLLLAGGDNIGASEYTSASQQDEPTLEMLNALQVDASSVGNHEFDQGHQDLTGRVADRAQFPYLSANVRVGSADGPLLMEGEGHNGSGAYDIIERGGIRYAVIGATTTLTPEKVAPSATEGLVFTDPVEEVNRVAAQIQADGSADVIVAAYHDGSTDQASAETSRIWQETSQDVDIILGGDTHAEYNLTQDVDGDGTADRAYLQTGSYGANLGKISVTYDAAADDVDLTTSITPVEELTGGASADELAATHPRVAQAKSIVDAAVATAERIGSTPAGEITADITTAFAPNAQGTPVRDDRQNESALGNLLATAFRDELAQSHSVDIGVINPGGIRNELYYADDPAEVIDGDADGQVTEGEINNVAPFANTMNTVEITGAQFRQALEQQWQPAGSSRAFLHLGLSDNVQYTVDESRPVGERITSVTVDGQPLDEQAAYTIGTVSFLAQGGDGFTAFAQGSAPVDTGRIDRALIADWFSAQQAPVAPSFERRALNLTGSEVQGDTLHLQLSELNMTSLGAPANTSVEVRRGAADGPVVATGEVTGQAALDPAAGRTGGAAALDVPLAELQGQAAYVVVQPAGTVAQLPAELLAGTGSSPSTDLVYTDLHQGMLHYADMRWAIDTGLATGWIDEQEGTAEYRPLEPVHRDAVAAFLHRLAGSPEVQLPAESPFSDVQEGDLHYEAIVWAEQQGIIDGWADGTFRPTEDITRDAMAAMLYRAAQVPSYSPSAMPFSDVSWGQQHAVAMAWMHDSGIATGWADGTYRPLESTNRDAMAAFLHRFAQLQGQA